ncbi:hypothetical protein [Streptomyces sp. BA2]|uniref:hypothetical protein n=1 Tax=Streptomyces sp. BA2 TaxID=436595 RepID=UPI00132B0F5C|nr:hypothetical protein [Streptomyces sp. BA2]MWA08931.1 hypothetical protein [Streptomyces sp. BA2]
MIKLTRVARERSAKIRSAHAEAVAVAVGRYGAGPRFGELSSKTLRTAAEESAAPR